MSKYYVFNSKVGGFNNICMILYLLMQVYTKFHLQKLVELNSS